MKRISILLVVITSFTLLISGCGTTTKAVADTEETSEGKAQNEVIPETETPSNERRQVQQRGPGNQENNEAFLAMVENLNLSADQNAQFEVINIYYREKMRKLREEARASGEGFQSMREVFQKLRDEQNAALKNLLTVEQFNIYNDYIIKQRAERGNRQG